MIFVILHFCFENAICVRDILEWYVYNNDLEMLDFSLGLAFGNMGFLEMYNDHVLVNLNIVNGKQLHKNANDRMSSGSLKATLPIVKTILS